MAAVTRTQSAASRSASPRTNTTSPFGRMTKRLPTRSTAGARTKRCFPACACRHEGYLRVYANQDIIGTELRGTLKNIIAIAAGIVDGLQLGDNARASLMVRGMAEIIRFGAHYGARPETAVRDGISMPVTEQVFRILFEDKPVARSIQDLMTRDLKDEAI